MSKRRSRRSGGREPKADEQSLAELPDGKNATQADRYARIGAWAGGISAAMAVVAWATGLFDNPPVAQTTVVVAQQAPAVQDVAPNASSSIDPEPPSADIAPERKAGQKPPPFRIIPPVQVPVVQMVPPPAPTQTPITQRFDVTLRLRREPNEHAETIAIIPKGERFYIGERMGDYYYSELESGTRGFIRVEVVDQLKPRPLKVPLNPPSDSKK